MPPLQINHRVVGLEIGVRHAKEQFREELVKIAFEKALANQAQKERDIPAVPLADAIVEYADAVLAAMRKTPDTGHGAASR